MEEFKFHHFGECDHIFGINGGYITVQVWRWLVKRLVSTQIHISWKKKWFYF